MFTGIIEEIGKVKTINKGVKSTKVMIEAKGIFDDLKLGDSVATNGVCLTVTQIIGHIFSADVMNETLKKSSIGELKQGSLVNLERAMIANGRFSGHIVTGHIDGIGKICSITKDDIAYWYKISANRNIMRYIIEKGSITIDGISLTVVEVEVSHFSVSVIPHTLKQTTLKDKKVGNIVNLETDIIGKYIEKFMTQSTSIIKDFLLENGF